MRERVQQYKPRGDRVGMCLPTLCLSLKVVIGLRETLAVYCSESLVPLVEAGAVGVRDEEADELEPLGEVLRDPRA